MDFAYDGRTEGLRTQLLDFMNSHVYPAEGVFHQQLASSGDAHALPPIVEELKAEARRRGLWNLFLADTERGAGLTTLQYAPLAEISGRSPELAPEALNCSAPDSGNMEILAEFGTPEQQERWLEPLLQGEIRSCFAMTEPDVASSDPTNLKLRVERDGHDYVLNGTKWWATGASDPRCEVAIVVGVTDPDGEPHRRQSMVLVPMATQGVDVVRDLPVFGFRQRQGHAEICFENARVPVGNLLGEPGSGFAIGQARLGPGRVHHCMRLIGMAERAFELLCQRAHERSTFGRTLAEHGVVQDWIAESRVEIEQARLLVLKAAWLMDTVGSRGARIEISAIKVAVPRMTASVLDRAIQAHGGAGLSDDLPLASLYAIARSLRIADGPDEVHKMAIARRELRAFAFEGRGNIEAA